MFFVGLRLNVADHVAGRFQLEPFPVCLLHQVKAVKCVLFIVTEKAACLKHTVRACRRKPGKDFIRKDLLCLYHFLLETISFKAFWSISVREV